MAAELRRASFESPTTESAAAPAAMSGEESSVMVRVTGVQVPSTRAKHAFERRVTVHHHYGPWVWREVQAQLMPYAPPDTIRELELARPDGRYVISIGLLNPQPNPCRVNTRVSFAMGSWVCGDAFLLAKEYHEPYWLTRSFSMSDWEQLNLLLKAVATPDTPFFDLEQCAYLASIHTYSPERQWLTMSQPLATRAPPTRTARRPTSCNKRDHPSVPTLRHLYDRRLLSDVFVYMYRPTVYHLSDTTSLNGLPAPGQECACIACADGGEGMSAHRARGRSGA